MERDADVGCLHGLTARRQADVTQAAVEIFWQKGYRVASIQDVADQVGVLKGSLYDYSESKEDLLWRVIEDGSHRVERESSSRQRS